MFRNYFLIATRNLLQNKSYVIINSLGLGIALACCVTAYILIAYNIEFDNFHQDRKVSKIYKIHAQHKWADGTEFIQNGVPIVMAPTIAEDLAGIERFARYLTEGGYARFGDNAFRERISFADSTFFDMFDFPLSAGSHKSFKDLQNIIINQELATKYFGDEDPMGKVIELNFPNDTKIQVVVGGVVDKIPLNSSFPFSAIMRIEHFMDIYDLKSDTWSDWRDPSTFMELTSPEIAANMSPLLDKYVKLRNQEKEDTRIEGYQLEPFKSNMDQDDIQWGYANMRMGLLPLLVFAVMAGIILLIACFNLTNTTIAMTARRMKEVGVRKVVGATKWNIIAQFLMETILIITFSLMVGIAMSNVLVPAFMAMWELPYGLNDLGGVNLVITLLLLIFFASIVAGVYPAMSNSRFKPVALLKGKVRVRGSNFLTRVLVSGQFALSVIVLIAGVTFLQNTKFQESIDLGYDYEGIINVRFQSSSEITQFKNKISSNPAIREIATSMQHIGSDSYQIPIKIDTAEHQARVIGIGENYLATMGFSVIQGRDLDTENALDVEGGVIVNEAFVEKTNLVDPMNKKITVHTERRIVGIVSNHVHNLFSGEETEPHVFFPVTPEEYTFVVVRVNHEDVDKADEYLEEAWKELFPNLPYEGRIQEETVFAGIKRTNKNLEEIFLFLTVLGAVLSGCGIFALASMNVEKRSKEIGIRKALGASIANIQKLMNREFFIILCFAAALGSMGGYFLTDALLGEIYSHHVEIGFLTVSGCALIIFLIGILTTGYTILRASQVNPVEKLRYE